VHFNNRWVSFSFFPCRGHFPIQFSLLTLLISQISTVRHVTLLLSFILQNDVY
jgi:hypothetical protein